MQYPADLIIYHNSNWSTTTEFDLENNLSSKDIKFDDISSDLITYCILPLLGGYSLNLGLTCKRLYNLYIAKRDSNPLIVKRFERVKNALNTYVERRSIDGNMGVTFDRMYILVSNNENTKILIFAKTYYPLEDMDILYEYNLYLRSTDDEWLTHRDRKFKIINTSHYSHKLIEYNWLVSIEPTYKSYNHNLEDPFSNLWFAIRLKRKRKTYNHYYLNYNLIYDREVWDNNNGWNYSISRDYHYIPTYYINYSHPMETFWETDYIDRDLISLSSYLHFKEM